MKRERQSNFEILRIILMIAIPTYHLMVYSGMNTQPYNELTIPSLLLCSGSAIVADYAFMAMSAYFFLDDHKPVNYSKFLSNVVSICFVFVVKIFILKVVLQFSEEVSFYKNFFYDGAWWFIYIYLIIMLIHPYLNKWLAQMKDSQILLGCLCLGVCFIAIDLMYLDNLISDFIAFIFTYFSVAYLKKKDFKNYLGFKNKKTFLVAVYGIGFTITFVSSLYVKMSFLGENLILGNDILTRIIGKYSIIQFLMGIAVFLFFQSIEMSYSKRVNEFAKNVFYVFLLHETVMAIFWKFNKLIIVDGILPYKNIFSMLIWCVIYLLCSFAFAIFVRWIYEHTVMLLLNKFLLKNKGE